MEPGSSHTAALDWEVDRIPGEDIAAVDYNPEADIPGEGDILEEDILAVA